MLAYANIGIKPSMKTLTWLADSRSKVRSFPAGVQDDIGYALYAAQLGEMSHTAKVLHGLGSGVMEIVANGRGVDLCDPRLPEEIQGWDCDTEVRDRTSPATAQTIAQ